MNLNEVNILRNGLLSYHARLVYAVSLEPLSELQNGKIIINYANIAQDLAYFVKDNKGDSYNAVNLTNNDITNFIEELKIAGLISLITTPQYENYYDGVEIKLNLKNTNAKTTNYSIFSMHADWKPADNFGQLARMSGLHDATYSSAELNDYICYWSGQPTKKNNHAWTLGFIKFLQKKQERW
jgi:hypothetical protein